MRAEYLAMHSLGPRQHLDGFGPHPASRVRGAHENILTGIDHLLFVLARVLAVQADLATDMVREFTELQGTMGGIYALLALGHLSFEST